MHSLTRPLRLALASLALLPALPGATDPALVEMLVANGVITRAQSQELDLSSEAGIDPTLLRLLVQNGAITSAQAATLSPGASVEAAAPMPAPAPAARPGPVVKPKEKPVHTLTVSGRVHGQMDYLETDYDDVASPDEEFNLFIRRLYLGVSAQLADGVTGTINTNFGNGAAGEGELEKALISIALSPAHTLEFGYQKTPFGFEETTSSSKIAAVERSIATRYFTEQIDYGARHTGIFLSGTYDSGLSFTLAATDPEQGNVADSSATDALALWGRLGWAGTVNGIGLELGLNGATIPEARREDATDTVWGFYASARFQAIRMDFEYLAGSLEDATARGDAQPQAFHLIGTWKISDAFELVSRAAYFDADGGIGADISTTVRRSPENGAALFDEAEAYYFGGNWLIQGNQLKLSAGYEWASFSRNLTGNQGDASTAGLRTRLQLLF